MTINHEGTWKDKDDFVAFKKGEEISFNKSGDGCFISVDGYQVETFHMNAEQFAEFKQWIMEN
jgi:hypothetical protein